MVKETCPPREVLEDFLLGRLSSADRDTLGDHLLECDVCVAAAETITSRDDLTDAIRAQRTPQIDNDELVKVIERSKLLAAEVSTQTIGETVLNGKSSQGDEIGAAAGQSASRSQQVLSVEASFLAPAQEPDEIGRLGDYRVLSVLGTGGMGIVFRAEDPQLKRQVALKVMKPSIAASETAKERFLREARFNASIEHDHIVHIYQVGEDRGVPFIAMQFLRGESLKTRLEREGRLSQTQAIRIGKEVAAGLAAAHERGLIHRDIKPDNVWLEEKSDRAKILDFGLVRAAAEDSGLTMSGMIMGTPRYMAPEQAEGQAVDHRCDLFSLGSMLYHLATGRPAFEGKNITATLLAVTQQEPQALREVDPALDPEFAELVTKLLSKDKDDRPQTAQEVSELFQQLETRQQQTSLSAAAVTVPLIRPVEKSARARPQKNLSTSLLVGLGGLFAVLLLGAILFTFRSTDGTVFVELTSDVEIQSIEVDGQAVEFSPDGTERRIRFDVDPGERRLTIKTTDGLELTTSLGEKPLEIKAGASARLKAWVEPKIAGTTPPSNNMPAGGSKSLDREIAEWVLSVTKDGRSVFLRIGEEEWFEVKELADLPDADFQVNLIRLENTDDAAISAISDHDLERIGQLESLVSVTIGNPSGTVFPAITDAGIENLSHSPAGRSGKLAAINIHSKQLTDASIPHLNRIPSLRTLGLQQTSITDAGMRQLNLPNLCNLFLSWTRATPAGLEGLLSRSPHVFELFLDHAVERIGDADFSFLSECRSEVAYLSLLHAGMSDGSLTSIGQLTEFAGVIHLTANPIHDAGVKHLRHMTKLRGLHMDATEITDESIPALSALVSLTTLTLSQTKLTEAGIQRLHAALPNCRIHSDFGTFEPVAGSKSLDREIAEWVLSVPKDYHSVFLRIGEEEMFGVKELADLPDADFKVVNIRLDNADDAAISAISDHDLERIGQLECLVSVTIGDLSRNVFPAITDAGIEKLSQSPAGRSGKLNAIYIPSGQLTDASIPHLNRIHSLRTLGLQRTSITDAGMRQLNLPNLHNLYLSWTRVTPAGLQGMLIRSPHLFEVGLDSAVEPFGDADFSFLSDCRNDNTSFDLRRSGITDGSLKSIGEVAEFPGAITLDENPIHDEGVRHLRHMTKLRSLSLPGTDITDASIPALSEITALTVLKVQRTKLTEAGIQRLHAALPNCRIHSDFGTFEPVKPADEVMVPEFDPTPPEPLGTWQMGPEPPWYLPGGFDNPVILKDGEVLPGLIDRPARLPGIKRWNVDTCWPRGTTTVARWSPDGKWIATGSTDGHTRIHDATTLQLHRILPGPAFAEGVWDLSWHPDSQRIAIVGGCRFGRGFVRVFNLDVTLLQEDTRGGDPCAIAWNRDGTRIAVGFHDSNVRQSTIEVRDAAGDLVRKFHGNDLHVHFGSLAWSPDDQQIGALHTDGKLRLWNSETGEADVLAEDVHLRHFAIAWNQQNWIALHDGQNVRLYDDQRKLAQSIPFDGDAVAWHPDGQQLFLAINHEVKLWDCAAKAFLTNPKPFYLVTGGSHPTAIACSPDGQRLVTAGGMLRVDSGDLKQMHFESLVSFDAPSDLAWSPDGKRLGCVSFFGNIRLMDTKGHFDGSFVKTNSNYPELAWHPESRLLAAGLYLIDMAQFSGPPQVAHNNDVLNVAWSPDGRYAALGTYGDGRESIVVIIDRQRNFVAEMKPGQGTTSLVAWSRTRNLLVVKNGQQLLICDPQVGWTLTPIAQLPSVDPNVGPSLSPDGNQISVFGAGWFSIDGTPVADAATRPHAHDWRADGTQYVGRGVICSADGAVIKSREVNGFPIYSSTCWHPRGHIIASAIHQSAITAWDSTNLQPYWHAVLLPDGKSATFSGAGELLHDQPADLDPYLVYYLDRGDGQIETLTPAQFRQAIADAK